jgi:hypothetical protein
VNGDLSILFGDANLRSTAVVGGDVMTGPGSLTQEAGAQVRGRMVQDVPLPPLPFLEGWTEEMPELVVPPTPEAPEPPELQRIPEPPERPRVEVRTPPQPTMMQQVGRFVGRVLGTMFLSALAIAGGMLVVFIWPRTTRRVSRCISAMPLQSLGLGLLTFLIAAALEVLAVMLMVVVILVGALMIGTVILIPIGLLLILLSVVLLLPVPLALAGGMVLGWVATAEMIGRRAFVALRIEDPAPLSAALVGLLITVPLAAMLWLIMPACCGLPFVIVLTSLGLGAVFHTRFGTQECRSSKATVLPADAMEEEVGRPDVP